MNEPALNENVSWLWFLTADTQCARHGWTCALLALMPLIVVLLGCDTPPYKIVPVSGAITLDGKPLAGALINTQPVASGESLNPGPGSFAKTDEEGRFSLELVSPAKPGAIVGTHRVRISKVTMKYLPGKEDAPIAVRNPLPRDATNGSLQLSVPDQGTDQVHFDLLTKKKKRRR